MIYDPSSYKLNVEQGAPVRRARPKSAGVVGSRSSTTAVSEKKTPRPPSSKEMFFFLHGFNLPALRVSFNVFLIRFSKHYLTLKAEIIAGKAFKCWGSSGDKHFCRGE